MRDPLDGSLARLQRIIADAVRGSAASSNDPQESAAGSFLVPGKRGLAPADRLEIYREQFWLRHVSNLVDDFPTLRWVVGPEAFRQLAASYLTAHPPRTWNLQQLGAYLPAYVADEPRWATDLLAVDACRLDWAFMEAFEAPDSGPLDLSPLASASEDSVASARLTLHPSIRRLALNFAVHDLRDAVRRGEASERPDAKGVGVVVWRDPSFALRATAVESMAFELLAELAAGTPLGEGCASLAKAHGTVNDLSKRVGAWFQQWTANGWVSAIELAG